MKEQPVELLIMTMSGRNESEIARAQAYARGKVGGTQRVEVGDTYGLRGPGAPYDLISYTIQSTRVEVSDGVASVYGICQPEARIVRVLAAVRKQAYRDLQTEEHKPEITDIELEPGSLFTPEDRDKHIWYATVQWIRADVDPERPGTDDALYTVEVEGDEMTGELSIDGPQW